MDIEIRSVGGNRVGFVIGSDIKDNSGNRVGMVTGSDIKDNSGNRVGMISGNDIKDIYGNRVGMIAGNDIKDIYGNRAGYVVGNASNIEIAAAALLLLDLDSMPANNESRFRPVRERPSGCLGIIFGLLFFIFKANLGGKIGIILGVVMWIGCFLAIGGMNNDGLNIIFMGLAFTFLFGIAGAIIGAITNFIIKLVKKNK